MVTVKNNHNSHKNNDKAGKSPALCYDSIAPAVWNLAVNLHVPLRKRRGMRRHFPKGPKLMDVRMIRLAR